MTDVEELICAILRGENPQWPSREREEFASRFLERSAYHGVQALVHHRLQETGSGDGGWGMPRAVSEACRNQAFAQAMWELRHRWLLQQALGRLSKIGARPVLFKGTALAYSLYPAPFLRTRGDTDLVIPPDQRDRAIRELGSLGLIRQPNVSGEFITYEAGFEWIDSVSHQEHVLDLHWRISNSEFLSHLLSYEEVCAETETLPGLSTEAIAVRRIYALLLACLHPAVHQQVPYYVDGVRHYGGDRLIWFYDIHCLLGKLSASECREFAELAERKGLRMTCRESVERARTLFGTLLPESVDRALSLPGSPGRADRYLQASASCRFRADFQAIAGMRNKLQFLVELCFPPEPYMRWKYAGAKPRWLPWLYLRRAGARLRRSWRGISA